MRMPALVAHLLQLAWFMLPAYAANMAPPFARFWPGWNRPIHAALLGSHKTVVGVAFALLASVATAAMQARLDLRISLPIGSNWMWTGLGFGAGAMGGDCLKSWFKRRRGIAPGQRWVPFDQLDFVAGALLVVGPFAHLAARDVVLVLAMSFAGDLVVNRIAYRLGIRSSPW